MHKDRIAQRKSLRTRVVFEDEFSEEFLYFLSEDISLSGIFVQSNLSFKEGTKIFLKFSLNEGDVPIQVTGEVSRLVEDPASNHQVGLGIRFLGLTPQDLKKIERFIYD